MFRSRIVSTGAILFAVTALGCGDGGGGPDVELYQIVATETGSETLADGTVRHIYQVRVTDGNLRVAGAWMLFSVTAGDVSPQSDRTDGNGEGRVEWTLEAEDYAGITSATLSGCAQDLAPPDCTPAPLASLSF
jgi:hypothetical protein